MQQRQEGACPRVDKALSLDGQRRERGFSFRRLGALTGLSPGRVHRAVSGSGAPADQAHVGRLLRSSDPELLAHVQQRAVPFLAGRVVNLRASADAHHA